MVEKLSIIEQVDDGRIDVPEPLSLRERVEFQGKLMEYMGATKDRHAKIEWIDTRANDFGRIISEQPELVELIRSNEDAALATIARALEDIEVKREER